MKKSNKKNKKASKPKKSGAPMTNTTEMRTLVRMGGCAVEYGRSLVNPFSGPSACVPTYPVSLTRKLRTFTRGTFSTSNTSGFGFVVADPSQGIASDVACGFASLPGGVQVNFDWSTVGNASTAFSNSDYVAANIGNSNVQMNYKVVSCGLKIRYTGTELDRGGQILGLQDQDHRSLYARTFTSIDGEETSRRFSVDKKWKRVLYRPLTNTDLDFQSALPAYTPAATDPSFFMGWAVQAPNPATSLAFEYEIYFNYEVFGRNVRGTTKSHVDPVGAAAVQAVVAVGTNLFPTDAMSGELEFKMISDVAKYVHENTTTFHQIPVAGSFRAPAAPKRERDIWDDIGDVASSAAGGLVTGFLDWLF